MAEDPVKGVKEPEYVRDQVVMPTLAYLEQVMAVADERRAAHLYAVVLGGR
jgi:hypothetical protein